MRHFVLFAIVLMVFSCKPSGKYYEDPIKDWMNKNLEDYSSYEPVETIVMDSASFIEFNPYFKEQLSSLENIIQREMDLMPLLINANKVYKSIPNIIETRSEMYSRDLFASTLEYNRIVRLLYKIRTHYQFLKNDSNLVLQMEGTIKRYNMETQILENKLMSIGTSLSELSSELNMGVFIYHTYRSKNKTGSVVLSRSIFKLDKALTKVEKQISIE